MDSIFWFCAGFFAAGIVALYGGVTIVAVKYRAFLTHVETTRAECPESLDRARLLDDLHYLADQLTDVIATLTDRSAQ